MSNKDVRIDDRRQSSQDRKQIVRWLLGCASGSFRKLCQSDRAKSIMVFSAGWQMEPAAADHVSIFCTSDSKGIPARFSMLERSGSSTTDYQHRCPYSRDETK